MKIQGFSGHRFSGHRLGQTAWLLALLTVSPAQAVEPYQPLTWDAPAWATSVSNLYNVGNQTYQSLSVGDINGDGCDDLAVAVRGDNGGSPDVPGSVWIRYGSDAPSQTLVSGCSEHADQRLTSTDLTNADGFGTRVLLSDLNGDGYADLLVSAPTRPRGPEGSALLQVGAVMAYFGSKDGISLGPGEEGTDADSELTLWGAAAGERFGSALASAADLVQRQGDLVTEGQDGADDVWIGFGNYTSQTGVLLWPGSTGYPSRLQNELSHAQDSGCDWFQAVGNMSYESFAHAMLTIPTTTGNTLLLGDPNAHSGRGVVYQIPVKAGHWTLGEAVERLVGPSDYASLGLSLAGSAEDFLFTASPTAQVSAGEAASVGLVWRLQETPESYYAPTEAVEEGARGLGWSLLEVPDLNGDRVPELLASYPGVCDALSATVPARIYLMSGQALQGGTASTPLPTTVLWEGGGDSIDGSIGDCFGFQLVVGDFNGDGHFDLAVLRTAQEQSLTFLWSIEQIFDQDEDGVVGYLGQDCAPEDASVYPGAAELCDGLDQDCDGSPDADEVDWDTDGYRKCDEDCNDQNAAIHPEVPEQCNGVDDDCDKSTDEDLTTLWYRDADGDGHGADPEVNSTPEDGQPLETSACKKPDGYASSDDDCDDNESTMYVGSSPVCDGLDNDCDGELDEASSDQDGDGFYTCLSPDGSLEQDCNDTDVSIYPGAPYVLGDDPNDQNCDGDAFSANPGANKSISFESGCAAVNTSAALVPMGLPLLRLMRLRRRRGSRVEKLHNS